MDYWIFLVLPVS